MPRRSTDFLIQPMTMASPILAQRGDGFFGIHLEEAVAVLVAHLPRQIDHVLALVMVLLQGSLNAERLLVAPVERLGEGPHLRARVVQVVLALHLPAGSLEHPCDRVAEHCVPGGAHVQGTGGVGADEFHLARPPMAQIDIPVRAAGRRPSSMAVTS